MKTLSIMTGATLSAYALAVPVHAAEVPKNAVIVTATRTAETVDETLAAVTVFDRADIERSQAQTVAGLLTGSAGVDAAVSGGYGKATSLFLRGTNADHVVVLIDGVRVGSATLGTASWQYLPLAQIDRIEIVRGPRSSLYGADAIGGVIQIFTRKGEAGLQAGAHGGYGTYNSREYAANVAGASSGWHFSAAAAHTATDGINARKVAVANEPDDDGYRNTSFSTRVGYRFGARTEVQAHALHATAESEYDSSFTNETEFVQNAAGLEFHTAPTASWDTKLQVANSTDETDDFLNGVYASTFDTKRRLLTWQNDLTLGEQQLLTLGADRQTDLIESSSFYPVTSRDNTGVFAQYQGGAGAHDWLLGLRHDNNEAYDTNVTGNIAWGYELSGNALRLLASYGTAFKAPTFNQLYHPFVGNPDVQPEESETFELGVRGKLEVSSWAVHLFQSNVDNLIVFLPPTFVAVNVSRARIRGIETEYSVRTDNNRLALYVTLLDPRDADTKKLLPRRSKQTLKLDEEYTLGRWRVGGTWLLQSHRYDDPQNNVRVGGYGIVDLQVRYDIDKRWYLKARAGNIFDKEYETAASFNSPGRNFFATLGFQHQ